MKNKIIIIACSCLLLFIGISGCKKITTGFLSDNLRYTANPLTVGQGVFLISTGIANDGSTPPFKITLLDVRNKATGKREEAFFKDYEVAVWKKAYNPLVDTTLALIDAKRGYEKKKPLYILESSGQLMFTQASDNVPAGEYLVDLQIENPNGTKVYKGICTINLTATKDYEYVNNPYFQALPVGSETAIPFPISENQPIDLSIGQAVNATLTIKRLAATPNQIVFKVLDKNGAVFPGKALSDRPSGNTYLKNLKTFAYKTTVTDTAILYDYAQARFPDPYWDNQSNALNCYYRIYENYIQSIDYADPLNWSPPTKMQYLTYTTQPVKVNFRINTKLNKPGKYLYELKLRLTKKP
ncbi:DUF5007 domain-containing protein [Pedobacter boryungensis]|uniref:DUF5007 domain-containing protein n=1 Tax=Pedobacter boryungensis TaxID=869962 RepID=A0ABX2DH72_9SPHI|nr:DUF5007 domain-containing protein [Pedobacter boryungensis]NQX32646.1 DUF5007 domain-containing protein [Pedobacter boryungensis]